jgi:TonB family protein
LPSQDNKEAKSVNDNPGKKFSLPLSQQSSRAHAPKGLLFDVSRTERKFFPMGLRAGILAVLWCGIPLADSPLTHAQDATSANLPESADTLDPESLPLPKKAKSKPRLETAAKASNQKPTPAAEPAPRPTPVVEQTPPPEEPATAPTSLKKARVKKRATAPGQDEPTPSPVAAPISLSVAQTMALSAPLPEYPYEAKRSDATGTGVCVMTVDTESGKVIDTIMTQSTGNAVLDKVTTETFKRWRFKPGTVSQVRVPITYE